MDAASLQSVGGIPSHVNLNDGTLEGFVHPDHRIMAVQFHPEAHPGPHDSAYLFDEFTGLISQSAGAARAGKRVPLKQALAPPAAGRTVRT